MVDEVEPERYHPDTLTRETAENLPGIYSVCSAGVLCRCYQPHRFDHLWARYFPPTFLLLRDRFTPVGFQTSRTQSKKIGEESRLSISAGGGNISSTTTLRSGRLLLECFCVFSRVPQIDKDRAVAAGASYGGYAIKYVLSWIYRDRD